MAETLMCRVCGDHRAAKEYRRVLLCWGCAYNPAVHLMLDYP